MLKYNQPRNALNQPNELCTIESATGLSRQRIKLAMVYVHGPKLMSQLILANNHAMKLRTWNL
jgi:hypothetical protein